MRKNTPKEAFEEQIHREGAIRHKSTGKELLRHKSTGKGAIRHKKAAAETGPK